MKEKIIATEEFKGRKYQIIKGLKNGSCYPCCWEGSIYLCPSELCKKYQEKYGFIYLKNFE
jgi:hypothetical protein